jgi:hypothetical protein
MANRALEDTMTTEQDRPCQRSTQQAPTVKCQQCPSGDYKVLVFPAVAAHQGSTLTRRRCAPPRVLYDWVLISEMVPDPVHDFVAGDGSENYFGAKPTTIFRVTLSAVLMPVA